MTPAQPRYHDRYGNARSRITYTYDAPRRYTDQSFNSRFNRDPRFRREIEILMGRYFVSH